MVQRKTGHDRFGQEHGRSLEPEMMKRPRPSRLPQQKSPEKQIVAKVTGLSPNYMKGTSSSEARRQSQGVHAGSDKKRQIGKKLDSCSGDKKQSTSSRSLKKSPSFKRSSTVGRLRDVNSQRETCSSFLKGSNFPEYLKLTSPGVLKLCRYTYCSLNAHLHLQFPPLKSFISARRRFLNSQTTVKMSDNDGCVDIESKEDSCNDDFETLADAELSGSGNENIGKTIEIFLEQSDSSSEDQESEVGSFLDNSINFLLSQQLIIQDEIIHCLLGNDLDEKLTSNKAGDWEEADGEKVEKRIELVSITEETLLNRARKPCNREECIENWREFNPREPNYLPIFEELSSEKTELKHQDMDERKKTEEWMIDYALRHTVTKLAPKKKKKVALLVEAFETILLREPSSTFIYGRHLQACK